MCKSKNPGVAPFAMLWNAASLLTIAERTRVVVHLQSVSIIIGIIRGYGIGWLTAIPNYCPA